MSNLATVLAVARHHRGAHLVILIVLIAVVAILAVSLVRQRRSSAPVHDDWKPPVDPPDGPTA